MSLKIAHIIFVTLATSMSLAGAYWACESYNQTGLGEMRAVMVLLLILACALLVYGVWFYRKLKKNPIL